MFFTSLFLHLISPALALSIDEESISLTAENNALITCSAAFAIDSVPTLEGQNRLGYSEEDLSDMVKQRREFFVRSLVKIMDETGMSRDQVSEKVRSTVSRIVDQGTIATILPACSQILEASVLDEPFK